MLVDAGRLEALFKKVQQVQEEVKSYCLGGDAPAISVDDLQYAVESMYGLKVSLKLVDVLSDYVDSFVLRYRDNTATIVMRKGMTDYAMRFAAVKELSHLVLDEHEDWSPDPVQTITGLLDMRIKETLTRGRHIPANDVLVCEHIAELAAAEFLYPVMFRNGDRQKIVDGHLNETSLSQLREIHPRVIGIALDEEMEVSLAPFRPEPEHSS